jgi:Tetratricopeptide repeat
MRPREFARVGPPAANAADCAYLDGVEYERAGRLTEALEYYRRAVALRPDHAGAHNNMGVLRQQWGQTAEAVAAYQRAVESNPQLGLAWFNLGNCLREENRLDEAVACYERARLLLPADSETRLNLATTLRDLRRFDEAHSILAEIPQTSPDRPQAEVNRALIHLLRGDLARGWDEYASRLKISSTAKPSDALRWDGTPLSGRSILLLSEQGIGDQAMFASCLPDLLATAGPTFVECDARLVPLFARSFPQVTAIPKTTAATPLPSVGPCDVVDSIASLPRFLRRRIEDFPARVGYLRSDPERSCHWRSNLGRTGSALKVGISWHGGKDAETRRRRSISLDLWGPIFQVPGVRFFNIQYGAAAAEAVRAARDFHIPLDDGSDCDPLQDLDDFAAKLSALDLILTVDNSTAHLAAALAKPVWTLLPFAADWRWMLDRETTPWYPTMRLLRCRAADRWSELLQRTARCLTSAVFTHQLLPSDA